MLPITQFPQLVEHYANFFEPLFTEASFIQFKRYISGLLVSENKTITGINQLFVNESRNQTSLNRWLKDSPFSLKGLNQARLNMLASVPRTRIKPTKGVLSLDDTLLSHYGQHFENIAKLWDHVSESYVWAHNMVSLHYSDEQTDYPISFDLWEPTDVDKLETGLQQAGIKLRENKFSLKLTAPDKWRQYLLGVWRRNQNNPDVIALYRSKFVIAKEMLTQWVTEYPDHKLPVTFDPWYTKPFFCRYLNDTLKLPYVGTLSQKDEVVLREGKKTLKQFATDLKAEHLKAQETNGELVFEQITFKYKGQQKSYYSYCQTHHIAKFGKQRLVINYSKEDLSDTPVFYISNRFQWHAKGITRIRRHRWPIESYYEEGKAEGLDKYQLRDFEGIKRHLSLVAVTYSILRAAQQDTVLRDKLQQQLKIELEGTPAFWRRATQADMLWQLSIAIAGGLINGEPLASIMASYIKAVCP